MDLTSEQQSRIRLLSDTELYEQAERFVHEHGVVEGTQIAGLLDFARSFGELSAFVARQKGRDWGWGKKAHYADFYQALDNYLRELRQRIQDVYDLVPEGLTKNQRREQMELVASRLAQEFIQHLAAESTWQEALA